MDEEREEGLLLCVGSRLCLHLLLLEIFLIISLLQARISILAHCVPPWTCWLGRRLRCDAAAPKIYFSWWISVVLSAHWIFFVVQRRSLCVCASDS